MDEVIIIFDCCTICGVAVSDVYAAVGTCERCRQWAGRIILERKGEETDE